MIFLPVWADDFDVKEAVNVAYQPVGPARPTRRSARRSTGRSATPARTRKTTASATSRCKPGLALPDEAIEIERNDVAGTVSIRVSYVREVQLKPLKKIVKWRFTQVKQGPVPQ